MREGLKLIQTPGRYWANTSIGWLRRVGGDEYELVNARTIVRTGQSVPLRELAVKGLGKHHRLSNVIDGSIEELHRLGSFRRCLVANEKAWLEECPKPKGWDEEMAVREK